ncbi:DUF1365 domain-containing protein [Ferrimonas aestuarii]|uniref:DUF1365 domain-containing protein n=1 Tax=Ferrimonas aestuarii TaxID=2569539 RepID=A0A4V5NWI7_9GAMM|nr:DUF1365 domain-containing protein [Ferrimonas aestuarii]
MSGHGIYIGKVHHHRYQPKIHKFAYPMYALSIDLDQLDSADFGPWLRVERRSLIQLRHQDYLEGQGLRAKAVWDKVNALGGEMSSDDQGKVRFVGQGRCLGFYFSPLNLYYCYNRSGNLIYLLAEVSNTPWNERHYYLLSYQKNGQREVVCNKDFHVSPFMSLAMRYHWRIAEPCDGLTLTIENRDQNRIFTAGITMQHTPMSSQTLKRTLRQFPAMTWGVVAKIYWQALKLFVKSVPLHTHPKKESESSHG